MESTKGESYLNWMETHFNVQRRLYDYQFSLSTTLWSSSRRTRRLWNSTTPPPIKVFKDRCDPPIPLVVLGEARGGSIRPRS